ncbi:hypothetical protein MRX96_024179 [Rhipicephalus microplus]
MYVVLCRSLDALEEVRAQLLELGARDSGVEVDTIEEGVNPDACLHDGGEDELGPLSRRLQSMHGTCLIGYVYVELSLDLPDNVVFKVESLRVLNGQKGNVERASAEVNIENEIIAGYLVQAVGQGSGRRFALYLGHEWR